MTELGWAWGTDRRIEPWSAYFEIFELLDRNPELLSPSGPDFWLFAHRGHGINSYGFGLIARVGQLLIAQQFAYGGAYQAIFEQEGQRPTGAECLNAGTHAWGATLEHLKNQPGPLRIAVFYSNYRAYAEIWTNDTALADAARGFGVQSDRGRWSLPGWFPIIALPYNDLQGFNAALDELTRHSDPDLAVAATHLHSLGRLDRERKADKPAVDLQPQEENGSGEPISVPDDSLLSTSTEDDPDAWDEYAAKGDPHPGVELIKDFPSLFGCRKHQPQDVTLHRWREPLFPERSGRETFAHGRTWSVAIDGTEDPTKFLIIVDLTWAADSLRDLGVNLETQPLVAIQHWSRSDVEKIDGCDACMSRLEQLDELVITHLSKDEVPAAPLPKMDRMHWSDPPEQIAKAVLDDLRARSILGEAMTSLGGTARWDLVPRAPVYIQFMLTLEGALRIEMRKDFTYWRTEVDAARVSKISAAGFSVDDNPLCFEQLVGPDPLDLFHLDAITSAIGTFVHVYEPKNRSMKIERLEGASPFDGDLRAQEYAAGQRMIDRLGRAELMESCDEELDEHDTDELTILDVLLDAAPAFAEAVILAHLDEFFDRVNDLVVLAPVSSDEELEEMLDDRFTTPEELAVLVLRHVFRPSEQRRGEGARGTAENDADPDAPVNIESLARERLTVRFDGATPTEVEGITTFPDEAVTGSNGIVIPFDDLLRAPELPALIVPRFE
ncbi:MAG: hypothetical protein F2520_12370 [Actinobacteria bacterium]|uniref:Unannotated protein n=1 Tax=freshwater metagenome TaxID=449393 RepID=A0A6J5YJT1_9ZZZZ|nr:hypothetical protein [Actinomycetota bacterium]